MHLKKHWVGVIFYILLQGLFWGYAGDLEQQNHEQLFMTVSARELYQDFLKEYDEKKILLTQLSFPRGLGEQQYQSFYQRTQSLAEIFPKLSILTPYDLLRGTIKENNLASLKNLWDTKPKLKSEWIKDNSLIFLTLMDQDIDPKLIASYLRTLKKQETFSPAKVQFTGLPYINEKINEASYAIKFKLFPILFAVVFILTLVFVQHFKTSLLLFIPALGSVGLSLAITKLLFGTMNMVTSIGPLLIFVLNLSLSFHLYFTFRECGSIHQALKEKHIPFILMILTTTIGFGALVLSEVSAIRQFGILSSIAILISAGLTVFWSLATFPAHDPHLKDTTARLIDRFFARTLPFPVILGITLTIFFITVFVFPKIPISTDATSYFSKKSGIKAETSRLEKEWFGTPILELVIHNLNLSELKYAEILEIDEIENQLQKNLGEGIHLLSANQLARDGNYLYTGEWTLPDFELSYQTLKSQAPPALAGQYPINQSYRLTLLGNTSDYETYSKILKKLDKLLDPIQNFKFEKTGVYFNILMAQKALLKTLGISFTVSLLIITVFFFLYFRQFKMLGIFFLANLLPLLTCLIFLYAANFSLNVATVMVFSVALGMTVDSTLHILYALSHQRDHDYERYFRTTLLPILLGSLTLIVGFGIFAFYDFLPIRQFGGALAFTLLIALLINLFGAPTLLTRTTRLREYYLYHETKN